MARGLSLILIVAFEAYALAQPAAKQPAPQQPAPSATKQPAAKQPATKQPAGPTPEQNLFGWLGELERMLPQDAAAFEKIDLPKIILACNSTEQWATEIARFSTSEQPLPILQEAGYLILSKQQLDKLLDRLFELRVKFTDLPIEKPEQLATRQTALINYLQATSALLDLSGRMRYLHRDGLEAAANLLAEHPAYYKRLIEVLEQHQSSIGAIVMAQALFDPPAEEKDIVPATPETKRLILRLIGKTAPTEILPDLVEVLKAAKQPADVRIAAAEAILQVGLPQQIRSGTDPTLPKPAITPAQLYEQIQKIPTAQLSAASQTTRTKILATVTQRMKSGLAEPVYQYGNMTLKPGDWLLMRNPSPYNLFSELSPGLYSHVGIVAYEKGSDGIRRMVVLDMPERGTTIPAVNVEIFLRRTLNYAFLRHEDTIVAETLAQSGLDCIGNPCEFDLNFRTARVAELAGKSLKGAKIHTYCAGLLLLCSQQTERPRTDFFPLNEMPPLGLAKDNFAQLGVTFGDEFISPTGILFSKKMQLVARREPMYDPRREIEEAIFDHFAYRTKSVPLVQSPDTLQALRTKLAESSKSNPLLAQALGAAANLPAEMDLVAAAKLGAVVETLDEIAFGNSAKYTNARLAIVEGPAPPKVPERTPAQVAELAELRATTHRDLAVKWDAMQLPPRALRMTLVNYYINRGKQQLDERFFKPAESK
jgi:hypothetical protein